MFSNNQMKHHSKNSYASAQWFEVLNSIWFEFNWRVCLAPTNPTSKQDSLSAEIGLNVIPPWCHSYSGIGILENMATGGLNRERETDRPDRQRQRERHRQTERQRERETERERERGEPRELYSPNTLLPFFPTTWLIAQAHSYYHTFCDL